MGTKLPQTKMMEIKINIDDDCKLCKEGIRYFKYLNKQHKGCYMNVDMETYKLIDGLMLIPDFNSEGHLTHFHISKADKENLKLWLKVIESKEKEIKIIKELKDEGKWL